MGITQNELLTTTVAEIIGRASIISRLATKKKLIIKFGVDPTSSELHLGHALALRKLRQFQDLNHQVVLLIGDFTARIGDPSGANKTRPMLTEGAIAANMKTYLQQAAKILNVKKAKVVYNSAWLSKMSLSELLDYASRVTLNNLIERDDFATRLKAKRSVGLHELLYPLTQAIDSVMLKADVELGGWDQRLNLLLGRELQKKMGQVPQEIILLKPLIGLDGQRKMSSSYNNYIGLSESPSSMFGKIMAIPDSLIVHYGALAALIGDDAAVKLKLQNLHPRDQKAAVAEATVELYHGRLAALTAKRQFNQTFRDKLVADQLSSDLFFSQTSISLLRAVAAGAECSNSQAARLIAQGAISLDGTKMADPNFEVDLQHRRLLRVGKHNWRKLGIRR